MLVTDLQQETLCKMAVQIALKETNAAGEPVMDYARKRS